MSWSTLATRFCVTVLTSAIGIAANFVWTAVRPQPLTQQHDVAPNYDSAEISPLRRRIVEAKANGDSVLQIVVLGCGWDIGSLREALSRDTVVLAELAGKTTYEDTDGLHTWYRFKIKETLVEHPHPYLKSFPVQSAPPDMLPIAEDEFLIQETNGQMEIDGIKVTQSSNGAQYLAGQIYLLFLWIEPSKRIAIRSGTDPVGVFLVDSDENIRPYLDRPYPLKTQLQKRFKNSIKNLRQALKN